MNLGGNETTAVSQKAKLEAKEQAKRPPVFISKERDHKFDLLLHLITNLRQPLILCGARGVGKTRFLQQLDAASSPQWTLVHLKSSRSMNAALLFEQLESQLQWGDKRGQDPLEVLQQRLLQLAAQKKLLVLLIDNSGELSPGVISELFRFCESSPALRLVLAMTPDQLQIKQSTDPAVGDFHVVEIPALNEQQCGDYLRSLTAGPDALLSFKAINPLLVQTVYQATDGIPGKIQTMLPELGASGAGFIIKSQVSRFRNSLLLLGGAGVLFIGGFLWMVDSERQVAVEKGARYGRVERVVSLGEGGDAGGSSVSGGSVVSPYYEEPEIDRADNNDAVVAYPAAIGDAADQTERQHLTEEASLPTASMDGYGGPPPGDDDHAGQTVSGPVADGSDLSAIPVGGAPSQSDPGPSDYSVPEMLGESGGEAALTELAADAEADVQSIGQVPVVTADEKWIAEQDAGNYTIQIIALSAESGVQKLAAKYPQLEPMAYFRSPREKGDLFPLVYGSFTSRNEALAAQKKMPGKLGKGWLRRFSSVQKEMRGE